MLTGKFKSVCDLYYLRIIGKFTILNKEIVIKQKPPYNKPYIFVFDVESTSLIGKPIAFGVVVLNMETGEKEDCLELLCTEYLEDCNDWVKANVLPVLEGMPHCRLSVELRNSFWTFYLKWKERADIWADCAFPVETGFMMEVAKDNLAEREAMMPFPLYDLVHFLGTEPDRFILSGLTGLSKHKPYDDALASAKCIYNLLKANTNE